MLLDESREGLASRVAELSKEDYLSDNERDDYDDQEDTDSQEETPGLTQFTGNKRKAQKRNKPTERTLLLRWRGAETGEGEIQLDPTNEYTGHLQFCDNAGFRFDGAANFAFTGKNVGFKGYEISSSGGPAIRSWSEYSDVAYERVRVRRWRLMRESALQCRSFTKIG